MEWLVLVTFFVALFSSTISGIGGGGGGFIMMPYLLFIGLPPANALATGKLMSAGTAFGSITAFKGKGVINKKLLRPLMAITFVCALFAAFLVPRIDPTFFENAIGVLLIIMVPTLFIKKPQFQPGERTKPFIVWGFVAYTVFSFMQTVVGTGMGSILVLILMFLFGLTALEANATKRVAQSVQAVLLIILLSIQGLVMWAHGLAGLVGSMIGSHIGSHIAIKKGSAFVKYFLAGLMLVSGAVLIIW